MRRVMLAAVAAAAMMWASRAAATIHTIDFTVNPGSWQQNFLDGAGPFPVTDPPLGLTDDPTLTGQVVVDDTLSGASAFVGLTYATGSKTWLLSDVDALSFVVSSGGQLDEIFVVLGPLLETSPGIFVGFNGFVLDDFGDGGSTMIGDSPDTPRGIFCNGCTTFTDTVAGGAVPEPSTWALMLLGFGGLGAVLRRRSGRDLPVSAGIA